MASPFFSVVIPTYNRATLIIKAIDSVLLQTFTDWELIIVDDASVDNTKEVVAKYRDSRILYHYKENEERSAARNRGIELSKGQYICFLDSDDYYLNNRLEALYNEIISRNNPKALFFTDIEFTDGIVLKYNFSFDNIFDYLLENVIGVPQVVVEAGIVKEVKFNKQFYIAEDLELWLRMALHFPVTYLPGKPTVVALQHEDRTVNERKFNQGAQRLIVLKYIFKNTDFKGKFTSKIKHKRLSDTYFSIARHHLYNKNSGKALVYIIKSVFLCSNHKQTKHKLYVLLHLLKGKIPFEYR